MNRQTDPITLVLDQGSHASRIALYSSSGDLLQLSSHAVSTQNVGTQYEQDPIEILNSFQTLLNKIRRDDLTKITSCGLCTQRSSIVAWHRSTGKALSPMISWRDLRGQAYIDSLITSQQLNDRETRKITGLPLSAHYSASKMHWLHQHNSDVYQADQEGQLCISPIASFLLFHLLKEQPCNIDHSNAQRMLLLDIESLEWSNKLLDSFQLTPRILPTLKPVIHPYGRLKNFNIPLTCVCGDQNAAVYAYPELNNESALINMGTGAFVLSPAEEESSNKQLLCSLTSSSQNKGTITANHFTEGTVNGAGAAISWAENVLPEKNLFQHLPDWLNTISNPPIFINTVAGIGSPWWCDAGEPEFIINQNDSNSERYVAIIESIAFLIYRNLEQLKQPIKFLFLSGGLAVLDELCQKISDLSRAKASRYKECESTARGCATLTRMLHADNDHEWNEFEVEKEFFPEKNKALHDRYQQFVGELQKRCSSN